MARTQCHYPQMHFVLIPEWSPTTTQFFALLKIVLFCISYETLARHFRDSLRCRDCRTNTSLLTYYYGCYCCCYSGINTIIKQTCARRVGAFRRTTIKRTTTSTFDGRHLVSVAVTWTRPTCVISGWRLEQVRITRCTVASASTYYWLNNCAQHFYQWMHDNCRLSLIQQSHQSYTERPT